MRYVWCDSFSYLYSLSSSSSSSLVQSMRRCVLWLALGAFHGSYTYYMCMYELPTVLQCNLNHCPPRYDA